MGAAYILTGSVNQACVESGSSDAVRQMLAEAQQADVTMAPAADMFEMGVKVQVLKRGTMFPMRATKLFELYRAYPSWEAIPEAERVQVEKTFLRTTFAEVWEQTRAFFLLRIGRKRGWTRVSKVRLLEGLELLLKEANELEARFGRDIFPPGPDRAREFVRDVRKELP